MQNRKLALGMVVLAAFMVVDSALAYYDPSTGRFLSRDPIEEVGGVHLYAYCHNRPALARDPLGLTPTEGELVAQLQELVGVWQQQGFVFSAHLLTLFLNKGGAGHGAPSNPIDLSQFSGVISGDSRYRKALAKYVAAQLGGPICGDKTIKLDDKIPVDNKAFSAEFAGFGSFHLLAPRGSGSDLTWALGTGHFGHTNATIAIRASSEGKCCKDVTFSGDMIQKDQWTFPSGFLRNLYEDYRAGNILETQYGYRSFWHVEKWGESMQMVCCPAYNERPRPGRGPGGEPIPGPSVFGGWICSEKKTPTTSRPG
jgi:hypothetical protein